MEIGELTSDGSVYVGKSASTGKDLFAAAADAPSPMNRDEALAYAKQLAKTHPGAHVPTPEELDANLFANREAGALRDTFNASGELNTCYLSSGLSGDFAQVQWFDDGFKGHNGTGIRMPVRIVWSP